jgi:hypothetical protein
MVPPTSAVSLAAALTTPGRPTPLPQVKAMVEAGGDVNAKDSRGYTVRSPGAAHTTCPCQPCALICSLRATGGGRGQQ